MRQPDDVRQRRRRATVRSLSWWTAAAVALGLARGAFGGALAQNAHAERACTATVNIACGLAHKAFETTLLFAGLGFLVLGALFFVSGLHARVQGRAVA